MLSEDVLKRRKKFLFGRRLGTTITRRVSNEADLKQAVVDANGNTGDDYHVTVADHIQFSSSFPSYSETALRLTGAKMSIFGDLSGSKVQLSGQGQTGGYGVFSIQSNSVVHLEMLKITNGHSSVNDFFLFCSFWVIINLIS